MQILTVKLFLKVSENLAWLELTSQSPPLRSFLGCFELGLRSQSKESNQAEVQAGEKSRMTCQASARTIWPARPFTLEQLGSLLVLCIPGGKLQHAVLSLRIQHSQQHKLP